MVDNFPPTALKRHLHNAATAKINGVNSVCGRKIIAVILTHKRLQKLLPLRSKQNIVVSNGRTATYVAWSTLFFFFDKINSADL